MEYHFHGGCRCCSRAYMGGLVAASGCACRCWKRAERPSRECSCWLCCRAEIAPMISTCTRRSRMLPSRPECSSFPCSCCRLLLRLRVTAPRAVWSWLACIHHSTIYLSYDSYRSCGVSLQMDSSSSLRLRNEFARTIIMSTLRTASQ